MAVNPVPEGCHVVTAYLMVADAARAIDFYREAFGAREPYRLPMGDKVGHAEIPVGDDTHLMLSDEWPDMGVLGPFGHKWSLATHMEDVAPEEMSRPMQAWSEKQSA